MEINTAETLICLLTLIMHTRAYIRSCHRIILSPVIRAWEEISKIAIFVKVCIPRLIDLCRCLGIRRELAENSGFLSSSYNLGVEIQREVGNSSCIHGYGSSLIGEGYDCTQVLFHPYSTGAFLNSFSFRCLQSSSANDGCISSSRMKSPFLLFLSNLMRKAKGVPNKPFGR